jgi:Rrf2 family nitric oxide-sensitive transcriptional repressor
MKLTSFTDYSLRVLIYLAAEPGRRATIAQISSDFDIAENHLTKVVHFLGKKGWISTVRGKGGGIALARPAQDIGVGQVLRDTEGQAMPAECFGPEESRCVIVSCCQLKSVLAEAVDAFYAVLDRYSLADISRNKKALTGILHFHRRELA